MNDQLLKRIRECQSLPSLPMIAMQVLELTRNADIDIAEIARLISKDPALSAKILKTVNSSFYGRSQHVGTISHALVILGLQSVKTLVLGFSLVANLTKGASRGFKHIDYWKRSIFAATAARTIAGKANLVQQEEVFLAALLMDIGMLVLDQVQGEQYGQLTGKTQSHQELAELESAVLGGNHAEVGGIIAEQWKLPPLLSTPIQFHHDATAVTDPVLRRITQTVYVGGRCADVFVDADPTLAIAEVRKHLADLCNLSESGADTLMQDIGNRTREVAGLFEINVDSISDYQSTLKRASEQLVELTLQSQMQANRLQVQNVELQRVATTDGLTGLANRAHFDQFLSEQFAAARSGGKSLSLLMLDVDKFKSINDKHGHPAGDQVLRSLGKLIRSAARKQDLAARFGGEEICLILTDTGRPVAATIAETVRRAVAAHAIAAGAVSLPITASIGVACYDPAGPFKQAGHLIKAADLAVYAAKKSGRNCVRVFTLPTTAAA